MIVARILSNGYFGGLENYPEDSGIPYGTTRTLPPEIPEGFYAIWAGSGWNLTPTSPVPIPDPEPTIPDVSVVSMRQARRVLFTYGYLDDVDQYINQLSSPEKELAQIDWEYATEVRKDSDLVQNLVAYLELTTEQLDTMFYEASLIV
jgi:hypothetical protein